VWSSGQSSWLQNVGFGISYLVQDSLSVLRGEIFPSDYILCYMLEMQVSCISIHKERISTG
jgi:hypothetical protein